MSATAEDIKIARSKLPGPFPLTIEQFEEWLKAQEGEGAQFTTMDGHSCPIASALDSIVDQGYIYNVSRLTAYVYKDAPEVENQVRTWKLPTWATAYVFAVDTEFSGQSINEAQALSILNRVKKAVK